MNKEQLKKIMKPLIKECIKEVMFEEGILSGIVAEVAQGLGRTPIVEAQTTQVHQDVQKAEELKKQQIREQKEKFNTHKKKLLDAIGKESYNGIDLFENTRPLASSGPSPGSGPKYNGPLSNMEPGDQGVNIDSLFGTVGNHWKAHLEADKK
jgi:hypothetical protein